MSGVSVHVNGRVLSGWHSARVERSLEGNAGTFEVQAVNLPLSRGGDVAAPVWSSVDVRLDGVQVLRGLVDVLRIRRGADAAGVTIAGRSLPGQLADCAAVTDPGQWRGRTVAQLAAILAGEYGIEVVSEVPAGEPIPRHRTLTGETVYRAIERLARSRALLVTDDGLGRVVLTRAGASRAAVALELPGNVIELEVALDGQERFSEYVCKGQRVGDDQDFAGSVSAVRDSAVDAAVPLRRVMTIRAEGALSKGQARARAQWEASQRLARATSVSCAVRGWTQGDGGPLWEPNQLVRVRSLADAIDGEFLIVSVVYTQTHEERRTSLTLAPPAAFELQDPPVARAAGGARGLWKELDDVGRS